MSSLMCPWPERMVEAHKVILAGCSLKTSTSMLMFELNGSCSDVQKTKENKNENSN